MSHDDRSRKPGRALWTHKLFKPDMRVVAWATMSVATLSGVFVLALVARSRNRPLVVTQLVAVVAGMVAIGALPWIREFGREDRVQEPVPTDAAMDRRWLGLVEECVDLLDELGRHRSKLDPAARELADHVDSRFQEILERSGVTVFADEDRFDRNRHQAERELVHARSGAAVLETLRPGLAVGRRVFRRAIVRLEGTAAATQTDA